MPFTPHQWQDTGQSYQVKVRVNGIFKGVYTTRQDVQCPCGATGFRRNLYPVVYVSDETLHSPGGCLGASPLSE